MDNDLCFFSINIKAIKKAIRESKELRMKTPFIVKYIAMNPEINRPKNQPNEPKDVNFPIFSFVSYTYATKAEGYIPVEKPTKVRINNKLI